jgi:hypothetical protein
VDFGYRRLLKRNGHVSPQKLNSLIDLDSELVSSLLKFDNTFKIVDATTLTSRKCSDFRQLIDDSRSILSSRRRLLR